MNRQDPLQDLLTQARDGGKLESEGSFTIAGEAAIGKLASFQLPRKSAWILKIVQSAVRCESPKLEIRQSNEATTFVFQPDAEFSLDLLKDALLSPGLSQRGAVAHLAIGLRTVGFGDKRAFTLALEEKGERTILGWNGKELTQQVQVCETGDSRRLRLGVAFPPEDMGRRLGGLAKSKGRATEESQELTTNAEVCPIPLYFDGRRVDRLQALPKTDLVRGSVVSLSVGWMPLKGELASIGKPNGLSEPIVAWRPSDKFTDSRVFLVLGSPNQERVNSLARLRYGYHVESYRGKHSPFRFRSIPQRSYVLWVKDGVVCQRELIKDLSCPCSFDLFLPADDMPTDISGLTLRASPHKETRVRHAKVHLQWQIAKTIEELRGHIPKPFGLHSMVFGAMGAIGIVAMPATFGKSIFATAAILNLAVSAYDKRKILNDCIRNLKILEEKLYLVRPEYFN